MELCTTSLLHLADVSFYFFMWWSEMLLPRKWPRKALANYRCLTKQQVTKVLPANEQSGVSVTGSYLEKSESKKQWNDQLMWLVKESKFSFPLFCSSAVFCRKRNRHKYVAKPSGLFSLAEWKQRKTWFMVKYERQMSNGPNLHGTFITWLLQGATSSCVGLHYLQKCSVIGVKKYQQTN